ncbi:nuclear transport factor 2 family protein [Paenibacillus sp. 1781tsa1]|uniref:nuclear transport factor 2 family protein n=1 Tax=Paenibacillus sp. 1781tsa1 TaxID=2953810 RepID=UPI00209DC494|nr:nuclear transport factor 2 family protein [Paenibacillus sp. 1781tsa1]MCP1184613.1 nuclear transport factor 2 family protein [Paenibacillus sp. 1781tsa1]
MKEEIIKKYFFMWVTRDFTFLDTYFSDDIIYRECYGAMYVGIEEVHLWIKKMLLKQVVLEWKIKNIHQVNENLFFVEWYFKAKEKQLYSFDGISMIRFDGDKIRLIEEYEAKHETFRPCKID